MSLLDDIRKALQGEKKSEFLGQILKEKELFDALKEAGLTVQVENPQARARETVGGLLTQIQKVDLIDLITEILTIDTINDIVAVDLIGLINKITEITTIGGISSPVDPYSLGSKVKVLDKIAFTYNGDGTIATVKGYEGASLTYTLSFTWSSGTLTNVVRT